MLAIKMTGAYTEEFDSRKFFFVNNDGEDEISRIAAGMFIYSWKDDPRLVHYEKDNAEYWELTHYYN